MRDTTRRRHFIHLACANVACLGLGRLRLAAWKLKPACRTVSVHAQVGEMFPPLELVQRMGDCKPPNFQFLVDSGPQGAHPTEVIHVGIRMPEFDVRHQGSLSYSAQEIVLRQLGTEVEKRFEWRIARATFDGNTHAFFYPYLGNAEGSIVFCRLEVKDYIAADAAQKSGFKAFRLQQA